MALIDEDGQLVHTLSDIVAKELLPAKFREDIGRTEVILRVRVTEAYLKNICRVIRDSDKVLACKLIIDKYDCTLFWAKALADYAEATYLKEKEED